MTVGAWRLLVGHDGPGAWQMAVDGAIQAARGRGECLPTLRLYRFDPPCVTIGRFQDETDVDLAWCAERGIDVARRPTGGRGVLHDDELTYSMVAHTDDGIPRGTAASYRYLCAGLVGAFRELGIDAELTARDRGDGRSGACYLHATRADLSVGAAKLSGSAQVWHRDVCLQHGSFVRSRRIEDEACVFGLVGDQATELDVGTLAIVDALGRTPSFDEISEAVIAGVSAAFGVELVPGDLSERERVDARGALAAHAVSGSAPPPEHQGVL